MSILEQEQAIKQYILEVNRWKVGREVLFNQYNLKTKLIDKGLSKSDADRFISHAQALKFIEIEVRKGRYGTRFKLLKYLDYEELINWRNQGSPTKVKSNAKVDYKPKVKKSVVEPNVISTTTTPKEYKLGQEVYFLDQNNICKGIIYQMELNKEYIGTPVNEIKNSNIVYSVITETGAKYCFEVHEFSDSIDSLFSILKSKFNNKSK